MSGAFVATALVIDAAYFLRRFRWSFPSADPADAVQTADAVRWLAFWHVAHRLGPDAGSAWMRSVGTIPN